MSDDAETWRIGDLADAAGLTVRTLHHYDQLGLLRPSQRNDGGHRIYTADDARRLYQIVALRALGLSLAQIAELLDSDLDPRPLVAEQVQALTAQIQAGEQLRAKLVSVLTKLETHERPTASELLDLIRETAGGTHITNYLSREQLDRLTLCHESLGSKVDGLVRVELPRLYREALAAYQANVAVSDPSIRAIVERIDRASAVLSAGDPTTTANVRKMWAERGEEIHPGSGVPWASLINYLAEVRASNEATPR